MSSERLQVAHYDLPNFGDQLSRLLLPKVLGGMVDVGGGLDPFRKGQGVAVYALGSYLSERFFRKFDASFKGVILGTGVGYPQCPRVLSLRPGQFPETGRQRLRTPLPSGEPATSEAYAVLWVRGPLSAQVLGFAPDTAIADAGYMVRHCDLIDLARDTSRSGVAFMPHITAARFADGLRRVCHDLGYTYVDPREPLETILAAIAGAELLVTEALHGAVIADAYRTPWLPVRSSGAIQELKWRDFTGAIGVDYRPLDVRIRWRFRPRRGPRILATLESLLLSAGAALGRLAVSERDTALDLLRAGSSPPLLSDADRLAQIDERIHDKLETLRTAWRSGTLFTSRDG